MPSNDGSTEPQAVDPSLAALLHEAMEDEVVNIFTGLTAEERDAIADGEPYCCRCGRPASSFREYVQGALEECLASAVDYVRHEEGTYNRATNRFACDGCYIAIGMPTAPNGWKAP